MKARSTSQMGIKIAIIAFCISVSSSLNASPQVSDDLEKAIQLSDENKYDLAILLFHSVIDQSIETGSDSTLTLAYVKLGSTLCKANKCKLGVSYFLKALNKSHSLENQELKSSALFGLGASYQLLGKYDSSLLYYEQTIPLLRSNSDSTTLSYIYSNLGILYSKLEKYSESEYFFNSAKNIQLLEVNMIGLADSYYNLGLVNSQNNQFKKALNYYKESLSLYAKSNDDLTIAKTLKAIGKAYHKINKYDSSSFYYYKYDSLNHDVFHQEYDDKILELETKFKTAEFERDNALKQGEIEQNQQQLTILYIVLGSLLFTTIGFYWFLAQRRKYIKAASDKQIEDLLQRQEIQATYALLEGQDKERKRIAIELHDNLGSILTSLNMFSDALQARIDPKEIKNIANRISETSSMANEEIRKISHSLDSGLLKHFGLKAAIKQLTEAVESAKKIKFDLELQINDDISNEKGLEVYRIIQELVNNAMKHAQCSKIHLEVNQIDNHLSIIFEDNGVGFDTNRVGRGMGLNNIYKRTQKLDGEFTIESEPDKGSTFIIELPNI